MDSWWGARSFRKPTIADALLQAGDLLAQLCREMKRNLSFGVCSIPARLPEDWGRVGQISGMTAQEAAKILTQAAACHSG